MRTPLKRIRGLGSANEGTGHFWHQRLTALANVPLVLFFVGMIVAMNGQDYATVVSILSNPFVGLVMIALALSISYHMRIGMQVIIEDYIHADGLKLTCLILNNFFAVAIALTMVFSIVQIVWQGA